MIDQWNVHTAQVYCRQEILAYSQVRNTCAIVFMHIRTDIKLRTFYKTVFLIPERLYAWIQELKLLLIWESRFNYNIIFRGIHRSKKLKSSDFDDCKDNKNPRTRYQGSTIYVSKRKRKSRSLELRRFYELINSMVLNSNPTSNDNSIIL